MANQDQNPSDSQEANAPDMERGSNAGDTVRASWNISLDDLRRNISNSSADAQELLIWCFLWCIDDEHPLRRQEFARRAGLDDSTIWRIIRGKYVDEQGQRIAMSDKIVKCLSSFRELEMERTQSKRTTFVMTPTARRIFTACDLARESQTPVFIIGPSHVGKTWGLREYTQENNHGHTVYVRLQAASGLGGMVRVIAKALGISDKANTQDLVERIKRSLKPNMLLILDEVHELIYTYRKESFFACLEVLREFYDAAGCGMVLCGTKLLFKRVQDNRGELEQLLRRGVHKVVLPDAPTRGDVTAVVEAHGLEMPGRTTQIRVRIDDEIVTEEPYKLLKQIGENEGLKAITERLRYGSKIANKAKAKLTWEYVVRAHVRITNQAINKSDW